MLNKSNRLRREVISIGEFRLFPSQRLLMRNNETIKLGGRAIDILLALSDKPGEIVSQRELITKVWPNVFVEDVSLRVNVAALRKALEHDGKRYLVNVPGRGYSLVAPTSRTELADEIDQEVVPAYSLPRQPLARVLGREADTRKIRENLLSDRLVTVVGPAGVGKTTVALSVAHELLKEFLGAVCFVELSPIKTPNEVPAAITSAFRLPVREHDPILELIAHVRDQRILLVLDSCEHLAASTAAIAERLLREASGLRILATSRQALKAEGEQVHPLPSLASPPEDESLTAAETLAYPAAQLFCDRVTMAGFGRELNDEDARIVGGICRRLGGIALAIELAAGRAAIHSIQDTASLLGGQFALLWPGRRTAPARHQTLHATLDWSHDLLSNAERLVLRRISEFAGSFTREAAQRVADWDIGTEDAIAALGGLAEKFLISTDFFGPVTRYRLLDTTRAYANRKLNDVREREEVRRRHALYFRELLRATALNEVPPDAPTASSADLDEVRAALRWTFDESDDALVGADIAAYSAPLWLSRALLGECRAWMIKAMAAGKGKVDMPAAQRLRIQVAFASTELFYGGFTSETDAAWTETLEQAESLGDLPAQIQSLLYLWGAAIRRAHYAEALHTASKCVALGAGSANADSVAMGEWMIGHTKHHVARFHEARDHLERYLEIETEGARLEMMKATGYDRKVDALAVLANTLWCLGLTERAKTVVIRAVEEARSFGFTIAIGIAKNWALLNAYHSEPDIDVIEHNAVEFLEFARTHSLPPETGFAHCILGLCQARRGQLDEGMRLVTEGLRVCFSVQVEEWFVMVISHICEAAISADRLDDAQRWMSRLDTADRNREDWSSVESLRVRGLLALAQGDEHFASENLRGAVQLARNQRALSWELRATMSLGKLLATQGRAEEAAYGLEAVLGHFKEERASADVLKARRLLTEWS
jgi:predicted ATPase/DNA-binding winged helix-turn-helix (wHTH) protein